MFKWLKKPSPPSSTCALEESPNSTADTVERVAKRRFPLKFVRLLGRKFGFARNQSWRMISDDSAVVLSESGSEESISRADEGESAPTRKKWGIVEASETLSVDTHAKTLKRMLLPARSKTKKTLKGWEGKSSSSSSSVSSVSSVSSLSSLVARGAEFSASSPIRGPTVHDCSQNAQRLSIATNSSESFETTIPETTSIDGGERRRVASWPNSLVSAERAEKHPVNFSDSILSSYSRRPSSPRWRGVLANEESNNCTSERRSGIVGGKKSPLNSSASVARGCFRARVEEVECQDVCVDFDDEEEGGERGERAVLQDKMQNQSGGRVSSYVITMYV